LGTVAPTDVQLADSFDQAVNVIAQPGFDPKRSVVVFDAPVSKMPLSPVDDADV
jgi:hypothetical protein